MGQSTHTSVNNVYEIAMLLLITSISMGFRLLVFRWGGLMSTNGTSIVYGNDALQEAKRENL